MKKKLQVFLACIDNSYVIVYPGFIQADSNIAKLVNFLSH